MTTTTTALDLDAIKVRAEKAARYAERTALTVASEDVPTLVAEVERLREKNAQMREQMAEVEKFVAARAEYITAINNCNPDNSADYWRWQGHAEGRRQLSQTLGLPVAWPADYNDGKR